MYIAPKRPEALVKLKKSKAIEPVDDLLTVNSAMQVHSFQKVVNARIE